MLHTRQNYCFVENQGAISMESHWGPVMPKSHWGPVSFFIFLQVKNTHKKKKETVTGGACDGCYASLIQMFNQSLFPWRAYLIWARSNFGGEFGQRENSILERKCSDFPFSLLGIWSNTFFFNEKRKKNELIFFEREDFDLLWEKWKAGFRSPIEIKIRRAPNSLIAQKSPITYKPLHMNCNFLHPNPRYKSKQINHT